MPIGNTDLLATKNDLIMSLVQRELIAASNLRPTIRDVSAFAAKGATSVKVPRAGSFTVEDRATTVKATLANVTYATDEIVMSRVATVGWVIDPQDDVESAVNTEADTAARAARALGKDVDTQIIAGLEADSTATTTISADPTQAVVLEMRALLLNAEADPSQLWFAIGPDSEEALLGISSFVDAEKYGSSAIPSGELGRLYGVRVVLNTGIAASKYYMYDSDGYGIAFQKEATIDDRKAPEYGTGAKLNTMDQKFGTDQLQNGSLLFKDATI